MRFSRSSLALATGVSILPVVLAGALFQHADLPAGAAGQDKGAAPAAPNRQPQRGGAAKAATRARDSNAPVWHAGPIPATITIRVAGTAKDEAGKPVAGAVITVFSITFKGSKLVAQLTADAQGRYSIRDAAIPVTTSFGGHPFPNEITPYAGFILSGLAPGLGIAWSPQQSMYALKEPHPDDIQGRLPFGGPVVIDITFPKASALVGKVVDEDGSPVKGAKLQVMDCDLLDDAGRETNNRQGYDWKALPGAVGRAVTAHDGSFRLAGLADRACFWISVNRPETDNTSIGFYAATVPGPNTVHEQLPPNAFNGRGRHDVRTNPITLAFPKIRPIAVTVVGDDSGKPIAGASVVTLRESPSAGISSGGMTDAAGKVLLGLPPGTYKGIMSDPPIETRYIRTYQRPLVVERGQGDQPYELRQKAGAEVIIQAIQGVGGAPVAGAFFWMAPVDRPEETRQIQTSTFWYGESWTDEKGELRAVFVPEPGKRYRFRFAGIHEANMPPGINPEAANKQGYESFPSQSVPVELAPGSTTRLRFNFKKSDEQAPRTKPSTLAAPAAPADQTDQADRTNRPRN